MHGIGFERMNTMKKNMLWNAFGNILYMGCQWLLTVLVTNLGGLADAGILSVAMSVSATFQTVALFGIRSYQVSDLAGKYSDGCYVRFRIWTCTAAFLGCVGASMLLGYWGDVLSATAFFMLFRLAEAFSDVLHGIAQKNNRLDVAGKSFAIKGVGLLVVFTATYRLTATLSLSLLCMALFSVLSTLLYDLPAVRRIAPAFWKERGKGQGKLAAEAAPLCAYLFASSAISTLPKLILEKQCGEELLGAYASIFAPALLITAAAGYLYNPFIPSFAAAWQGQERGAFLKLFLKISAAVLGFAAVVLAAGACFGEWGLTLLFGEKIRPYVSLLLPILLAISAYAFFCFLCMLEIVVRDFAFLLLACGIGLGCELLLTGAWLARSGANGASGSFIAATLLACAVLLGRLLYLLFAKPKKLSKRKEP